MKKLVLILFALGLLASSNALEFSYTFNSSLGLKTSELISLDVNENALVTIVPDIWLTPHITSQQMNGTNILNVNISVNVPANITPNNYTRTIRYTAVWDGGNMTASNTTIFNFFILNDTIVQNITNITNVTEFKLPDLTFVVKSSDGDLLQYATINLTAANFSAFCNTIENGGCVFTNMTPRTYDYYVIRSHYYSESGNVVLGNDSLTKTIILDFVESALAQTINDNIRSLQDTQLNMTSLFINNSVDDLRSRLSNLESANQDKDNQISKLSEQINSAFNQTQTALVEQKNWFDTYIRQRNYTFLGILCASIITTFAVLGGMYLRNNWVRFTFFGG